MVLWCHCQCYKKKIFLTTQTAFSIEMAQGFSHQKNILQRQQINQLHRSGSIGICSDLSTYPLRGHFGVNILLKYAVICDDFEMFDTEASPEVLTKYLYYKVFLKQLLHSNFTSIIPR